MNDLNRVEAAMIALSKGLSTEWAVDYVTALGWAWRFNALGGALCHAETFRTNGAKNDAKKALCRELEKQKIMTNGADAWDLSHDAVEWWIDKWCPSCKGAGHDFHQVICPVCDGGREKPKPAHIYKAVTIIDASLEWLDSQIAKSTREWAPPPKTATRQVKSADASIYGWVTPKASVDY